jgi:hypothetical protein
MVQAVNDDKIIFRELEKVRLIIDKATGLEITWAYDDLVFAQHNTFIIRFDADDLQKIHCYFNVDFQVEKAEHFFYALARTAPEYGMALHHGGSYELIEGSDENEVQIKFLERQ